MAASGCAKPARNDLYVLLPGQSGHVGAVAVMSGETSRVLDKPYEAARVTAPGHVETETTNGQAVEQKFAAALDAQPRRPISFTVYFQEGKDELTTESMLVVTQIFAEIANRAAPDIIVIGHTDTVGGTAWNDELSLRRAQRMRDELVKLGAPADRIRVAGRGKRELLVPTADGVSEPRNRRVEVSVR